MNIQKKIKEAMKRRHQNEAGFTLIELLVVILIIAILAAVAIAAFLTSLDTAKKSNATQLLRTAQSNVTSILASNGDTDLSTVSLTQLSNSEKDTTFKNPIVAADSDKNVVGVNATASAGANPLILRALSGSGASIKCYEVKMTNGAKTEYRKYSDAACTTQVTAAADIFDKKLAWK